MGIKKTGENFELYEVYPMLSNPIIRVDRLDGEYDIDKVNPAGESYKSRRAKDVVGEKGRYIDLLV